MWSPQTGFFCFPISVRRVLMWKRLLYFGRFIESRSAGASPIFLPRNQYFLAFVHPSNANLAFELYFRLPAFLANWYTHGTDNVCTYVQFQYDEKGHEWMIGTIWPTGPTVSIRGSPYYVKMGSDASPYGNHELLFLYGNQKIPLLVSIWGSLYGNGAWCIPVSIQGLSIH